jgi:hypothetical protein
MEARIRLQKTELKKSGHNKFANYYYFELADFIPAVQQIFYDVKLCGIVSYKADIAELAIYDTEDGSVAVITSPMSEASLKGVHPIQNLGAVETYQRRYLWMTAMEIVEHDRLDGGAEEIKKEVKKPEEVKKVDPLPAVVGGQPGGWQIVIKASPESLPHEWLAAVQDATKTCLSVAASPADVMDIFRKNKQVFDVVKAQDPVFFKQLMNEFALTKQKFEVPA